MVSIISYVAMTLSISGNWFINRKMITGLWIWLIGSILWFGISCYKYDIPQMLMFAIYTCFNIDGILKWKNTKIKINEK